MSHPDYPFRQPNSKYCFVCGLQNPNGLRLVFYDDGGAAVRADFQVVPHFQGYPGVVHGGIVASILDEAIGRVVLIHDHHKFMFTANLAVKYRQPVPTEQPLYVLGTLLKQRGRIAQANGAIYLADGTAVATAELTLADLPADFRAQADLVALGWRVYGDDI